MLEYLHERIALRTAVLRVFPSAGPLLLPAVLLQVVGGLAPVAFIVTTSAVVGRVPGAVEQGLDSPEWRSLRNVLLIAGGLFVLQQVLGPFQWTCGQMMAWRIDDELRERAAAASFGPVGIVALEDAETVDTLADLADPHRGTGFTPGWACWATLLLLAIYLQWAVATVLIGVVYA